MSGMDGQLRELFDIAAGEPPRQVTVGAVRRTLVRRRITASVAAALAVILAGGGGAALSSVVAGPVATSGTSVKPAYYLQVGNGVARDATLIRSTATGAITGRVHCPWHRSQFFGAAVASKSTFFVACEKLLKVGPKTHAETTKIYRFTLTAQGRITGYVLLRGGTLPKFGGYGLAVSPDGSQLAITGEPGGITGPPTEIVVLNTRTGSHRVWKLASAKSPRLGYSFNGLSFTGNGRELVYLLYVTCLGGVGPPGSCKGAGEEVRALNPADQGSLPGSTTLLFNLDAVASPKNNNIQAAQVSPDGSEVTLVLQTNYPPSRKGPLGTISVLQVSARSGKVRHVLYRTTTSKTYPTVHFFSADPSGRYLLLGYDFGDGLISGWIDQGKLRALPHAGTQIGTEIW